MKIPNSPTGRELGWAEKVKKPLICKLCKKIISEKEAGDSSIRMRKVMKDDDPNIFDIWFRNYCKDCADKYISGEITEL